MRLLQCRVQKRQQCVAELQILANDVFVILSKTPWLLIVTIDYFVIATKRRQKTDLIRTHQQLTIAATDKTSNVTADKRFTRQTKGCKHRNVQRECFPGTVRVTS